MNSVLCSIAPFIANAPDGLFSFIQESLGSLSVPILAVVIVYTFVDSNDPRKSLAI